MGFLDKLIGNNTAVDPVELTERLNGVLIDGENAQIAYKVFRDFLVFTQYRIILVDIQGVTGSKVDYTSIPYKAITLFSVETAGTFDLDAELKIWVSGTTGPIRKTLKRGSDVSGIQRALATGILAA
ncbi:PH (Pleckstrin Homology) domain-containing protein [Rhizobium sp. PP-F2F-G20b]|nr:PH (Pleckstrin Homology) domain-containing protein [Rhizobium sp. PP-F2F-G20b]